MIAFPVKDSMVIIIPLRMTPCTIDNIDKPLCRPITYDTRAPVHAPVPGRGIPTNNNNPLLLNLLYF